MSNPKMSKKKIALISSLSTVGAAALIGGIVAIPFNIKKIEKGKDKENELQKSPDEDPNLVIPEIQDKPQPPVDENETIDKKQASNFISKDQKIKYFAFGDSISAGYTGELKSDHPGTFKNNKLEGLSFPLYLASFIQKLGNNKLESFDNFAVSGSQIIDWIELLDIDYDLNSKIEKKHNTHFSNKNLLSHLFADKEEAKQTTINKIKESNLITISLGANDLLTIIQNIAKTINFTEILHNIQNKVGFNKDKIIELLTPKFLELLADAQSILSNRMDALCKNLKQINPNTNVVFINYPLPLQRLLLIIDDLISPSLKDKISINKIFHMLLTQNIRKAIIDNGHNFINVYDNEYWSSHQDTLTKILFDIHPSFYGYKKMASEVFFKISAGDKISYKLAKSIGMSGEHFKNKNVNVADHNNWIIELPKDSQEIYTEIFGSNFDEFLYKEDEFIIKYKPELEKNKYGTRINDQINNMLTDGIFSLLSSFLTSQKYKDLDPSNGLAHYFLNNNSQKLKAYKQWFIDSKILLNLLKNFQKEIEEKDWDKDGKPGAHKLKIDYLKEFFKSTFSENNVVILIKNLITSDFVKNNEDVLEPLIDFTFNALKSPEAVETIKSLLDKFYPEEFEQLITKKDLTTITKAILDNNELKSLIKTSLSSLSKIHLSNESEFNNIKNYNDLVKVIFKHNPHKDEIINKIKLSAFELISHVEVKPILAKILTQQIYQRFPLYFENIPEQEFKQLSMSIIINLKNIPQLNELMNILVDEVFLHLGEHGYKVNPNMFLQSISLKLKTFAQNLNIEKTIIDFLKVLKNGNIILNNEQSLKKITKNIITHFLEEKQLKNFIGLKIGEQTQNILTIEEVLRLSDSLFSEDKFNIVIDYVFEKINKLDLLHITNVQEILDAWFDKDTYILIEHLITNVLDNGVSKNAILKIGKHFGLFNNLTDEESISLLKKLTLSAIKIDKDEDSNLLNKLLIKILTSLINNKDISKLPMVIDNFAQELKVKFTSEVEIVKFIKMSISKLASQGINLDHLTILIKNIIDITNQKVNFAQIILNLIPSQFKKYLNEQEFQALTKVVISNEHLYTIVNSILKDLITNNDKYVSAKTVKDLVTIYINGENKDIFKSNLMLLLNDTLSSEPAKKILANGIYLSIKEFGWDFSDEKNQKLFADLANDVPFIIQHFQVDSKLIDYAINNLEKIMENEISNTDIKNIMLEIFDVKNFKNIYKLLTLNSIQNNQEIIKNDLVYIFNSFKSDPQIINKFLENSNLHNKFSHIENGQAEFNKLIEIAFKSEELEKLFISFFEEIIVSNDQYKDCQNWSEAINKLLKSTKMNEWKTEISSLIEKLLKNSKFIPVLLRDQIVNKYKSQGYGAKILTPEFNKKLEKLFGTIILGFIKTDLFPVMLNDAIDGMKEAATNENIEEYISDVISKGLSGALKSLCESPNKISIEKVIVELNKNNRAKTIFNEVDPNAFASFINFLFRYSPVSILDSNGLYGITFSNNFGKALKKYSAELLEWDQKTAAEMEGQYIYSTSINVPKFEVVPGNIFGLIGNLSKVQSLLQSIWIPLVKNYLEDISINRYTNILDVKQSNAYKALERVYAFLLTVTISNMEPNTGGKWGWGRVVIPQIENSLVKEIQNQLPNKKDQILKTYASTNLDILGIDSSVTNINKEYYFAGYHGKIANYSNSTHSNYQKDWLIYYNYYFSEKDNKYHKKHNILVLLKVLKDGYLE